MLSQMMDATSAGLQVGYVSSSQFSREYSQYFGAPPAKDIARLRRQGLTECICRTLMAEKLRDRT